jgi:hypothetical protein
MKTCKKCSIQKDELEFFKCKTTKDKLRGACKVCMKQENKEYCSQNKEAVKQYKHKYIDANREELNQRVRDDRKLNPAKHYGYSRKWKKSNPEKVRAADQRRRQANPEKTKESNRRNNENNRGTKNSVNARRRAYKLKATLDINLYKIELKNIYDNCPKGFHVDHIVPLAGKEVCGLHVPWNLQYLPALENIRKRNKLCLQLVNNKSNTSWLGGGCFNL